MGHWANVSVRTPSGTYNEGQFYVEQRDHSLEPPAHSSMSSRLIPLAHHLLYYRLALAVFS